MGSLARLAITAGVVIGTAVVVAIAAGILDLFLTGHGYGTISNAVISHPSLGVHLSIADLVLLFFAAMAGSMTWWLLPKAGR